MVCKRGKMWSDGEQSKAGLDLKRREPSLGSLERKTRVKHGLWRLKGRPHMEGWSSLMDGRSKNVAFQSSLNHKPYFSALFFTAAFTEVPVADRRRTLRMNGVSY
jgi:hypothetical protein